MTYTRLAPDRREGAATVTALMPERAEVLEATDDDLRIAVRHALQRAGCTFEELATQAKSGDFQSVRARMAWVAIADLRDLADR